MYELSSPQSAQLPLQAYSVLPLQLNTSNPSSLSNPLQHHNKGLTPHSVRMCARHNVFITGMQQCHREQRQGQH